MSVVTDTDRGWAEIKKQMSGKTITIEVWSQARSRSRTKSKYANHVEAGTPKMAARPFMAETMARHDQYTGQLNDAINCVLEGTDSLEDMMNMMGEVINSDMRKTIEDMGLVKTGRLRDKVVHAVKL